MITLIVKDDDGLIITKIQADSLLAVAVIYNRVYSAREKINHRLNYMDE